MDVDVVVIGAGAAGLAAALTLAQRSLRVTIVDGRDRVGGRVMWEPVGAAGVPAELGAEFIHGPAPETSALLAEAGLSTVETGGPSWIFGAGGTLRQAGDDDDFMSNTIFDRVAELDTDESVDVFLRTFENDPELHAQAQRARTFVEGFEAADPVLASARSIADELHSGVDATSARPAGSYAPLFARIATRVTDAGADLHLNTTVEHIAWKPGRVTVTMRHDEHVASIHARCAIVTVSAGVLQQRPGAAPLTFAPLLPAEKVAALNGLEMGNAVRVAMAFRTPFWEEIDGGRYRDAAFFRSETGTYNAFWTQFPLRDCTIVAWSGGPRAAAMNGMSAKERIDRALDEFGTMFGTLETAHREFEDGVTHDWSADPLTCGAYSYVTPGAATARATLGLPIEDTLFFAGEATALDGQGGTVSGAFATGFRAANELIHALERAGTPVNGAS